MSNRLLLVRRCAIFISLVHFLIFVSLCLPVQFPIQNPGEHLCIGWQEFFPCDPLPSDIQNFYLPHIMDYVIIALIALVVLVLPPLAAQAIFRPRWRIIGLPALWISLPLMLGACLLFMIRSTPAFDAHLAVSPATWFPPLGFALSFIACLILALHVPFLRANEQASISDNQQVDLASGQHERTNWPICYPPGGSVITQIHGTSSAPLPARC